MGDNITKQIQRDLKSDLENRIPEPTWETEYRLGRTNVDVAGTESEVEYLIELEISRQDPVNNSAKIMRNLATGMDKWPPYIYIVHVFSEYYDTQDGVSTPRTNAEFVGDAGSQYVEDLPAGPRVEYVSVDFEYDPDSHEANWNRINSAVDDLADKIEQEVLT